MGKLSSKRIKYQYDGYLFEWNFIADQDGDLWVNKDALLVMPNVYEGGANTIHVYGSDSWLVADLTKCIDSWVATDISDGVVKDYIMLDEVIDDQIPDEVSLHVLWLHLGTGFVAQTLPELWKEGWNSRNMIKLCQWICLNCYHTWWAFSASSCPKCNSSEIEGGNNG